MSNKSPDRTLSPADIKKLAKKIIAENPIYMPDEPTVVGSPKTLTEDMEECENDKSTNEEPKGSEK